MLISAAAMQTHELAVIASGISAARLMDEASAGIARCILQFFPSPGSLVCFCGAGNNAGDALAAAAILQNHEWRIAVRLAKEPDHFKPLPQAHWRALEEKCTRCHSMEDVLDFHDGGPLVLLDGLTGLGSNGPLRDGLRGLAAEMNALRRAAHAQVVAVDLPSGLDPDSGVPCEDAVVADITATIAIPKRGLLTDPAVSHVGRLAVIPVRALQHAEGAEDDAQLLEPRRLLPLLPTRRFDWHKGTAGRVSLIAGSSRFTGAAVLCSLGALRGGAGLVTLFCKENLRPALAARLPPEIMLHGVDSFVQALDHPADAIAIGPGLGDGVDEEACEVIKTAACPLVVDADALNALSRVGSTMLNHARGPRLLTPHPGEMRRLDGFVEHDRRLRAEAFAQAHRSATLLLKGSRTVIATAGCPTRFNSTGHPGMATGGMGDVLTGLLAALLCQHVRPHDAAALGSWLLGRAAELALLSPHTSPESLSATDVADHLGAAFRALREGGGF